MGRDLNASIDPRPRSIEAQAKLAGEDALRRPYQGLATAIRLCPRPGTRTARHRDFRVNGPLTLDKRDALEALVADFAAFHVDYADDRWLATRKDGTGGTLRGLTPDDLAAAMRAGWSTR